jgi:cytochrome d ubiquinol oxidase subunit I
LWKGAWLKTKNPTYYHHARFWTKLYVLNFGIGVASGLPMEFQFGTNWAPLSEATGDFLGSILGFEGAMAFMLEAGFLGIMLFGWNRVPPVMHYIATIMVAFGANLSTFWILTANSWLQTPAGGEFMADGKFIVRDYFQAILNPFMVNSVGHMFMATLETSLFVIGGISAWYILNRRQPRIFQQILEDCAGHRDRRRPPANLYRSPQRRAGLPPTTHQNGRDGSPVGNPACWGGGGLEPSGPP